MTESTKEQVWKEEARKAYQDQQSQDSEGGCRESIGFVQGYIAAKKSDFEEIELLKWQKEEYKKAISEFIGAVKALKEQLAIANDILEDLDLCESHSDFCRHPFEECNCMDRGHYNYSSIVKKARQYFAEKQDKENKDEK